MPAKYIIYLLLIVLSVYSCNKEGEIEEDIPESCPSMSGEFQIDALGNNHILQLDENTNFTILYGWYEENENATVIIGDDQNGKNIYIEASIPGELSEGTHYYNASSSAGSPDPALFPQK